MQGQAGGPRGAGVAVPTTPGGAPGDPGEQARLVRFLGRVGLFHGSSPELLTQVAAVLRPLALAAGGVACREGDPGDQFFIIESGTLAIMADIGGQPRELARLGPGEFFGEMALLAQRPRTATVQALTDARLWGLAADHFHQLLAHDPALDAVVRRAARLRAQARESATFEVERRNLAALVEGRQQLRIGRGLDNDLVFNSRLVSRHHAVVEWSGETYRLRDLGSSNGTFVSGREVRTVELRDGDEIWVGDQRFFFDRREIRQAVEPRGIRIDALALGTEVKGGKKLLQDIALSVLPGEFVAIVGGSGAGKTTLMDALSGVRPATAGRVLYNGRDYYRNMATYRNVLGYVPQDDIIHTSLPTRLTLDYAAKLRLPSDTSREDRASAVDQTLEALSLTGQADTLVESLSGGQRKRASIGVEFLTRPRIFFLDEPTSGLDPAIDAQMMRLMRQLADDGSTVILTTHATKNVMLCDKIVFLARGGHLAFFGSPQRALQYFGTSTFDEIYERLAEDGTPEEWAQRFRASPDYAQALADQPQPDATTPAPGQPVGLGASGRTGGLLHQLRQFGVLTRRNFDILTQHLPGLIPLLMQPLVIITLILILFNSGAFDLNVANPATAAQIVFFLAFGAFFFGVNYGTDELAKEAPIFRRERMVNLAIAPYVLGKVAVLGPLLALVQVFMLVVLRLTQRLPSLSLATYGALLLTLVLTSWGALALGFVASAAVNSLEQAGAMTPMLIMPQLLFSGAILAVPSMNVVGRVVSAISVARWSFEGLGRIVDLNGFFASTTSPVGRALLLQYGDTFSRNPVQNWVILLAFIVVCLSATSLLLKRKGSGR